MVGEIYSELQGITAEVLAEFAQGTITYIAMVPATGGTPDEPAKPKEKKYPFNSVARGVKQRYIDGSNIVASDLQATMPGGIVEPDISGFVLIGTKRHKIVQIDRKPAIGPAVAHVLIFKR